MFSQYKRQKVSEITSRSTHPNTSIAIINSLTENGPVKASFIKLENKNYQLKSDLEKKHDYEPSKYTAHDYEPSEYTAHDYEPSKYTAFEIKINEIAERQRPNEDLIKDLQNIGKKIKEELHKLRKENKYLSDKKDFDNYLEEDFYFNLEDHEISTTKDTVVNAVRATP